MIYSKNTSIIKCLAICLVLVIGASSSSKAQLDPLVSQYFNNQYLINPAFAGYSGKLQLNGAYRKLWNNVPGTPVSQSVTLDHGFKKVGLGLNFYNDKAGLERKTRLVGSYAYHLQLNGKGQQLHFGLSLGLLNQDLDSYAVNGNPNDVLIGQYNNRKTYVDGDFGIAYTSDRLSVQAAVPNLKSFLKKDMNKMADIATFYMAASYKVNLLDSVGKLQLEPKVAFRGTKGYDNIWDAGAQLSMLSQQVLLVGMYHSTDNATFGLGFDFKKKYLVSGSYTTTTSQLNNYINGSFELNLRVRLN